MGNLGSRDEHGEKADFLKSTSDGTLNTTLANYFNFSRAYNDSDLPIDQLKERVKQDLGVVQASAGNNNSSSISCRSTLLNGYLDPENEIKMQRAATVIDALCQEDPSRFAPLFIELGVVKPLLKFLAALFKLNMLDRTASSETSIVLTLCALSSLGLYDVQVAISKEGKLCRIFCNREFFVNVIAALSRANTLHSLVAASKAIIISITYDKENNAIDLLPKLRGILYNIIRHSRNRNARAICAIVLGHFAARGEAGCGRDLNYFLRNNRAKVSLMLRPIHVENLLASQKKTCQLLVAWVFAFSSLFANKEEFDRIRQKATAKLTELSFKSAQKTELLNLAMQKINPNFSATVTAPDRGTQTTPPLSRLDIPTTGQRLSVHRAADAVEPFLHSSEITKIRTYGQEDLFSSSQDAILRLWNRDGTLVCSFKGHFKAVTDFVFSENKLFSVSFDETIREWSIPTGDCVAIYGAEVLLYRDRLSCLAVTSCADGSTMIATGGAESIVSVIDTKAKTSQCLLFTGKIQPCSNGLSHPGRITGLEFSENGDLLYSSCACSIVRIWNVKDRRCLKTVAAEGVVKSIHSSQAMLFCIEGANLVIRDQTIGTKLGAIKDVCATTFSGRAGVDRVFVASPNDRAISAFRLTNKTGALEWEGNISEGIFDVCTMAANDRSILVCTQSSPKSLKIVEFSGLTNPSSPQSQRTRDTFSMGTLVAVQHAEDAVRIAHERPASSPMQSSYTDEIHAGTLQSRMSALRRALHNLYGVDNSKPVPIVINRRNGVSLLGNIFKAMDNLEHLRSRSFAVHFGSGNPNAGAGELLVSESMCKDLFEVAASAIVDPVNSLFANTGVNGTVYLHPAFQVASSSSSSSSSSFETHSTVETEHNFRLIGRFIGKCLLDDTKVQMYFAAPLLKIMLGGTLTVRDLAFTHIPHFNMLVSMFQSKSATNATRDPVAEMNIDFTTENPDASFFPIGLFEPRIELKEDGENSTVTSSNVFEFATLLCTWKLMSSVRPQLEALLAGLYDVIPLSHLQALFDVCDLELALCGEHHVHLGELQDNTRYGGDVSREDRDRQTQWFWHIFATEHSQYLLLRLVHFVFGSTGVVSTTEGFSKMTDPPFTIYVTHELPSDSPPISMPWNNTLVLPLYSSMEKMRGQFLSVLQRGSRQIGMWS